MNHEDFREEVNSLVRLIAGEYAEEVRATFDLEGEPDDEGGMTPCATIHLELRGGIEYEVPLGIRRGEAVIVANDDVDVYLSASLEGVYAHLMVQANDRYLNTLTVS